MKAILAAAGVGSRLRPLTDTIPKCLVPLNGKPLLDYWLESFERHGITEVLINGHYLADQVEQHLVHARKRFGFDIQFVRESELRGTGGTVRDQIDFVSEEDAFLLCHADNFASIDLTAFCSFHAQRHSVLSLALFRSETPESCGIVNELADDGCILEFEEKPISPKSNLASAAIFCMAPKVIADLPTDRAIDFSREILPQYQGLMFGYEIDGFNIDVGTLHDYERACRLAESLPQVYATTPCPDTTDPLPLQL
ncbi:MAG: mannose-1-phosphate guanylyltransferase [Planctomycetota bacterium]|jgi:mannose-1-phosphate guanylyltransferase